MRQSWTDKSFTEGDAIDEAVEWLLLDRASYEARLAQRWGELSPTELYSRNHNKTPAQLLLLVATHQGHHHVRDVHTNARIKPVFVEYRSTGSLRPGKYCWLDQQHLLMRSACKGEMVRLCIQALAKRRQSADYIAFVDDDVSLSAADLLEAADAALQDQITAFQLRLHDPKSSVWGSLLDTPAQPIWKRVGFIEMMAPVLHQSALTLVATALTNSVSGFGCDYYLAPILQLLWPELRIAVWGGASMHHERPVQTTGTRVFASGLTASQEEERLRATLLTALLKHGDQAKLPIQSLILDLHRELRRKHTSASGIERAFAATTHRHWSSQHDLAVVQQLTQANQLLSEKLREATEQLTAIETSKAWRAVALYRRCLNALRPHE